MTIRHMALEERNERNKPADEATSEMACFLDIPLWISVELGRTKMTIRELLDLEPGSLIQIPKSAGENVEVLINGKLVALGEVVTIEESMGVILTNLVSG